MVLTIILNSQSCTTLGTTWLPGTQLDFTITGLNPSTTGNWALQDSNNVTLHAVFGSGDPIVGTFTTNSYDLTIKAGLIDNTQFKLAVTTSDNESVTLTFTTIACNPYPFTPVGPWSPETFSLPSPPCGPAGQQSCSINIVNNINTGQVHVISYEHICPNHIFTLESNYFVAVAEDVIQNEAWLLCQNVLPASLDSTTSPVFSWSGVLPVRTLTLNIIGKTLTHGQLQRLQDTADETFGYQNTVDGFTKRVIITNIP